MASSVEPCESKPAGLTTLSSTLQLFDTFKPSQDEDKDSDEESFHLPMLDCDDDIDDTKETSRTATPNPENEDDILNKFDTTVTPDSGLKLEDSTLDDDKEKDSSKSVEQTSNQTENKDNEDSAVPAVSVTEENEKTDATRRLSEESDNSITNDKEGISNETKEASDNENTDSSEVFKDLEVVDELDDSHEEKSGEKTKEEDNEICEKTMTESSEEPEHMDVDKVESTMCENVQSVGDTKDDVVCGSEETAVTKSDESENGAEHVTEMAVDDEKVEESSTESTKVPESDSAASDVDSANKISSDEKITEESNQISNDAEKEVTQEETPAEEPKEEKMKCDEEEDDIINDIVKEVNEKMDSDDEEMMAEESVLREAINQATSPSKVSDEKVEECAELEEINSSACSNEVGDESATSKPLCEEESSDREKESSKPESESAIPEKTDDTGDRLGEVSKEDDSSEKMDVDVPLEDEQGKVPDQQCSVEEEENKEGGGGSDSQVVESKASTTESEANSTKAVPAEEIISSDNSESAVPESKAESKPPAIEIISSNKSKSVDSSKTDTPYEPKSNLECDDLLDVSIIRDVDEDNATAIEENANDNQSSEKSDNDDQDEDKGDNEMEESEADQEENLLSSDKDDHVDSEEGNSNSCDHDATTVENLMSENTSDGEAKGDEDVVMKEAEESKSSSPSLLRTESESETATEKPESREKSVETESQEKIKENGVQLGKRTFSETGATDKQVATKKLRLSESESSTEEKEKMPPVNKNSRMKTLITFEKFMQSRNLGGKKLTRSDLEQFCLQKICEAIVHKTDVGELHQTIKKQEVIIENLRKDLQQLTKQTRDLDIVNKKLMNELRTQNGNKKPLVPLKITRSVGLQVKLNIGMDQAARRKQPIVTHVTTPNRTPTNSATTPVNRTRNITSANAGVVRQVSQNSTPAATPTPSPRKQQPTTPILSQALQPRATPPIAKRPAAIRPRPAEPAKTANPGVIDLTDEDDKSAKSVGTPTKIQSKQPPGAQQQKTVSVLQNKNVANKVANSQAGKTSVQAAKAMNKVNKSPLGNSQGSKTVTLGQAKSVVGSKPGTPARTVTSLPQGVRLTPTQLKNAGLTIPANVVTSNASGTTQFMYVVQPSSLVNSTAGGGQKAVLLNFQPTGNGMIASTINGSAVSVIPSKSPSTVQLKTITATRKHPAPLPLPPAVPQNSSLKPLLPKPHLSIRKTDTGIILQWRMPYNLDIYEGIASYQLFAYQETNAPPSTDMWRKVGDVKALALPMACTLTQFADKNKYYFAVRSVDVHKRIGAFSDPEEISL